MRSTKQSVGIKVWVIMIPDEGSNVESGIPTDKDQHSELDVQDQKELSDFSATGRWQTGHADARQSYDLCKRLIGCTGVGRSESL